MERKGGRDGWRDNRSEEKVMREICSETADRRQNGAGE